MNASLPKKPIRYLVKGDNRYSIPSEKRNVTPKGKKKSLQEKHERAHVTACPQERPRPAFEQRGVPVELTELIFNDKMAALTAHVGSLNGKTIISKNECYYVDCSRRHCQRSQHVTQNSSTCIASGECSLFVG
ncbi:unnamed protein product [Thlaspi arvense]|uniref:Uncharacterized protein n=1 Tax=Thlaspi arvense TaxID=13288 RepID=A0AAU9RY89_THLAR|nr:unnamed protein product [Thlaspi arvense]